MSEELTFEEYPCAVCGEPIETAELCAECATGNDPFFTCDNAGRDLKGASQ